MLVQRRLENLIIERDKAFEVFKAIRLKYNGKVSLANHEKLAQAIMKFKSLSHRISKVGVEHNIVKILVRVPRDLGNGMKHDKLVTIYYTGISFIDAQLLIELRYSKQAKVVSMESINPGEPYKY